MEKVYKTDIVKKAEASYDVYRTCIIMRCGPNQKEVIKWLPLNLISHEDFKKYNYSINDEGDIVRTPRNIHLEKRLSEEDWKKGIITPRVAVAGIVESGNKKGVLIIKRKYEPFGLAFPGGMIDLGEKIDEAIVREVKEETGILARPLGIISVLSDPKYDPRWHVIVHYVVMETTYYQEPRPDDDAQDAFWTSLDHMRDFQLIESSKKVLEKYKVWRISRPKLLELE